MSRLAVRCYAGYRGEERPLDFTLGARTLKVREVQDRWYSPDAVYFRVLAEDGHLYLLRHDEAAGQWTLEGFRAQSTRFPQQAPPAAAPVTSCKRRR